MFNYTRVYRLHRITWSIKLVYIVYNLCLYSQVVTILISGTRLLLSFGPGGWFPIALLQLPYP